MYTQATPMFALRMAISFTRTAVRLPEQPASRSIYLKRLFLTAAEDTGNVGVLDAGNHPGPHVFRGAG